MISLRILGPIDLDHPDGTPVRPVVTQPKRFALLAYLASADPGARLPRDTLLGLLWADLAPDRARRALRQALHALRRSLGPGVVIGKGSELVGVDPDRLWCDASEFERAAEEGRNEDALELYRGAFLEGFYVDGCPRYERWIDSRRRMLRLEAVEAAWSLADQAEEAGEVAAARRRAEQALEMAPYDGDAIRRYMALMERTGQPAAALRAYQIYADRLRQDLELEPAAETVRLAEDLQAGEGRKRPRDEHQAVVDPATDSAESGDSTAHMRSSRALDGSNPGGDTSPVTKPTAKDGEPGRRGAGGEDRGSPLSRGAVVAAGVLLSVLAGIAVAAWPAGNGLPDTGGTRRSVAVLPFEDLSPRGDQGWFAVGVAEEILDALTKIPQLEVKGRSSSFLFGGAETDVRLVGDSLSVAAVLGGSVRRVGDRVRITVQLIRSSDASHLWSATYEQQLTPDAIFRVQEQVARSVAEALPVQLGLDEGDRLVTGPPDDLEAYSLYLRARNGFRQRSTEGRTRARVLLERSLERDSGFAPAWTLMARLRLLEPFWDEIERGVPLATARARALDATGRALELDPEISRAHTARAEVLDHLHRWEESRPHHRRAIELNSGDPDARGAFLWHLASTGSWAGALEHARYRQRLDPLYTPANGNLAEMLMYAGRLEEARAQWDRTVALAEDGDAHAGFVRSLRAKAFVLQGEMEEAVREARSVRRSAGESVQPAEGYFVSQLGAIEALAGNVVAARALLDSVRLRWREHSPGALGSLRALNVARVYASLGEADSTFLWLERSRPEVWRPLEVARFRGDPWWEPVRGDPRYREVLARMGVSEQGR